MVSINDIKIGARLNLILGLIMVALFAILTIYIVSAEKKSILKDADQRMKEQVDDLSSLLQNEISLNGDRVFIGMQFAKQYLKCLGSIQQNDELLNFEAVNQITKGMQRVQVKEWTLAKKTIQGQFEVVDAIVKEIGGTATIFQRIPDGFLRVSTNVMTKEGKRGVGTFIPNSSPVIKAILAGEEFYGRAFVVDDWYLTGYSPIVMDGNIEGIIYFGIKEKNLAGLKSIFKGKAYYDRGYPYIVTKSGEAIVHPSNEGEYLSEYSFFKEMINSGMDKGKIAYEWESQDKIQYYNYVKEIDGYVVATLYNEDMLKPVVNARNAILLAMLIGVLVFLAANSYVSKSITSGLDKCLSLATAMSNGDLEYSIDIAQKDEVGVLSEALRNMSAKLKEIITSVNISSNSILEASQHLNGASQQISTGASDQASSTEEVSSSMEEMTANIQQNTESSRVTEGIVRETAISIRTGNESSVVAAESMKQIAEKIQIINDIASQTNILALNAAVEAARAGEHGRGFSVVAAEVRKLAERSKQAADEIGVVSSNGVRTAQQAGEELNAIVPEIEKTVSLIQEIAAGSFEQSQGADQINSAIQQLNNITQQNAASSEELATSAEALATQAEHMVEAISFFKVNK